MLHDIVAELKLHADIVEVIQECGFGSFPSINTDRAFRGTHCESESGRTATNCTVNPLTQSWHCFRCGQGGDVINWVLHAKFQGVRGYYREAVEWLARFYDIPMRDTVVDTARYNVYDLLTRLTLAWHQVLLADIEKLEWVKNKWGLTLETIEAFQIGFCPGLSHYDIDNATAISAGLIDERANQQLDNRITIPFFKDGLVVWMIGRTMSPSNDVPKYLSLKTTSHVTQVLFNFDNAMSCTFSESLVFTEGILDAVKAWQERIRAVGVGGASAYTQSVYEEQTTRLIQAVPDAKYIVYDTDRAGQEGARNLAKVLLRYKCDPYIVTLPSEGRIDLADFLIQYGNEALTLAMQEAVSPDDESSPRTLPNILIDEIPVTGETDRLRPILSAIAPMDAMAQDRYLSALARKQQCKVSVFRKEISKLEKEQRKSLSMIEDREITEDIFPAQDFAFNDVLDVWHAHTVVKVPRTEIVTVGNVEEKRTIDSSLHIQTSMAADGTWVVGTQEFLDLSQPRVAKLAPDPEVISRPSNRWSVSTAEPYSVLNFIAGKTPKVNLASVYYEIHDIFMRSVWYPDERNTHIGALYTIFTYLFMGLKTTPYLFYHGIYKSGKSVSTDIITELGFNALKTSNISAAALYRTVHGTRGVLMIDEAERLHNPPIGSPMYEILAICNANYHAGEERTVRCAGADYDRDYFYCYCPKMFASTKGVVKTLRSRTIMIQCARPADDIQDRLFDFRNTIDQYRPTYQNIRDRLRVYALTQFREVRTQWEALAAGKSKLDELFGRDAEIWKPLLAIAKAVDAWENKGLYSLIYELAIRKVDIAEVEVANQSFDSQILRTLCVLYVNDKETCGHYTHPQKGDCLILGLTVAAIIDKMMKDGNFQDQYNRCDARFLSTLLRNIGVIAEGERPITATKVNGRPNAIPIKSDILLRFAREQRIIKDESTDNRGHLNAESAVA